MASSLEDDVFEKLKTKADIDELERREKEINARVHAQYEKSQQRVAELLGANSTLPVTISSIRVLHANNTRRTFLERIFEPLLGANKDRPYTLEGALKDVSAATDKLNKFDIFKSPISVFIDRTDPADPSTTPTDINVYLSAQEKSRYTIKTGTEAGNAEGSAYASAVLRNVFGGAETLQAYGSLGTRTRSSYSASFDTPILSDPGLHFEVGGAGSSTLKPWASHEEFLRGGSARLKWTSPSGQHRHDLAYSGSWRQITGLASTASPTVRADAGDSFKASLAHTYALDRRDYPLLPSRGYYLRSTTELAGVGPLGGDVGFAKLDVESQAAAPLPAGAALTAGLRGGLLYPLAVGRWNPAAGHPEPSRLPDRFQLGGPTDVRGFRLSGLGPRDGPDAVGGDVYAAAGASLLLPFPRVGAAAPLRFQAFVNGGRLLALQPPPGGKPDGGAPLTGGDVARGVKAALRELRDGGLPSCAAGVGIVYAHPAARFEVNFSLPLVLRRGEEARKGVSFGIGASFL
ncbi:surface antigen-domain-containing protein [Lineolata rhizophorae]|uniref:Surface antigen-domain-containing protein n=1 Tax=Lineolata rhizophorae TaxID=578093 RepID=A0A6A6P1I0_9PEZI|nr:surface antigen-domain-containing protein [Lineolata rhizophorae]